LYRITGAAQNVNGSVVVNPWNTEDLPNATFEALNMKRANHESYAAMLQNTPGCT
ncbi:hypothetical protein BDZ91DRAFT_663835, partial [Kalaharituber pfeilii]